MIQAWVATGSKALSRNKNNSLGGFYGVKIKQKA